MYATPYERTNIAFSTDCLYLFIHLFAQIFGRILVKCKRSPINSASDMSIKYAFLWHQGESDHAHGDKYYENLKAVVTYVRNHLSEKTGKDYSNLPFIFGTVAKKNKQYGSEVEAAMKRFAKEDKNAYLIDMSDCLYLFIQLFAQIFGRILVEMQTVAHQFRIRHVYQICVLIFFSKTLKRLYLYVHRGWRTNAKCVF